MLQFGTMSAYHADSPDGSSSLTVPSTPSPNSPSLMADSGDSHSSSSPLLITGHRFNGHNYLVWSQSALMFIKGRGKEDFLTGEAPVPATTDPKYKAWVAENNTVMSWLINSMTSDIGESYVLATTAKEIWDGVRESYSKVDNSAALFQIKGCLKELKQGDATVTQYYNSLLKCWQQLDLYEVYGWTNATDAGIYRKIVEKERIFGFLLGLNMVFDEVRGRIMATRPLPSLREVFAEVRYEESRKQLTLGSSATPPTSESLALATRSSHGNDGKPRRNGKLWCDHCHKTGHSKETCWKIHGKPANWKPKQQRDQKEGYGLIVSGEDKPSNSVESAMFNKDQLDIIQN